MNEDEFDESGVSKSDQEEDQDDEDYSKIYQDPIQQPLIVLKKQEKILASQLESVAKQQAAIKGDYDILWSASLEIDSHLRKIDIVRTGHELIMNLNQENFKLLEKVNIYKTAINRIVKLVNQFYSPTKIVEKEKEMLQEKIDYGVDSSVKKILEVLKTLYANTTEETDKAQIKTAIDYLEKRPDPAYTKKIAVLYSNKAKNVDLKPEKSALLKQISDIMLSNLPHINI